MQVDERLKIVELDLKGSIRKKFLKFFIRESYKKIINQSQFFQKQPGNVYFLFSYFCFLIEVEKSELLGFIEIIRVNQYCFLSQREISLLSEIVKRAQTEFNASFKVEQTQNKSIEKNTLLNQTNFIVGIEFEDRLNNLEWEYYQTLRQKLITLDLLNKDHLNLFEFKKRAIDLKRRIDEVKDQLQILSIISKSNMMVQYYMEGYTMNLGFGEKKRQIFKYQSKYNQELAQNKIDPMLLSKNNCLVFVSLVTDSFGVLKRSQNKFTDIFGYSKEEYIGKNINLIIPQTIACYHNEFLQTFTISQHQSRNCDRNYQSFGEEEYKFNLQNKQLYKQSSRNVGENVETPVINNHINDRLFSANNYAQLILARNKEGWAVPISIQFKVECLDLSDCGIAACLSYITSESSFFMVNEEDFKVLELTNSAYEQFFSGSLKPEEAKNVYLGKVIPILYYLNSSNRLNEGFQQRSLNFEEKISKGEVKTTAFFPKKGTFEENMKKGSGIFEKCQLDQMKQLFSKFSLRQYNLVKIKLKLHRIKLQSQNHQYNIVEVLYFKRIITIKDIRVQLASLKKQFSRCLNWDYNIERDLEYLQKTSLNEDKESKFKIRLTLFNYCLVLQIFEQKRIEKEGEQKNQMSKLIDDLDKIDEVSLQSDTTNNSQIKQHQQQKQSHKNKQVSMNQDTKQLNKSCNILSSNQLDLINDNNIQTNLNLENNYLLSLPYSISPRIESINSGRDDPPLSSVNFISSNQTLINHSMVNDKIQHNINLDFQNSALSKNNKIKDEDSQKYQRNSDQYEKQFCFSSEFSEVANKEKNLFLPLTSIESMKFIHPEQESTNVKVSSKTLHLESEFESKIHKSLSIQHILHSVTILGADNSVISPKNGNSSASGYFIPKTTIHLKELDNTLHEVRKDMDIQTPSTLNDIGAISYSLPMEGSDQTKLRLEVQERSRIVGASSRKSGQSSKNTEQTTKIKKFVRSSKKDASVVALSVFGYLSLMAIAIVTLIQFLEIQKELYQAQDDISTIPWANSFRVTQSEVNGYMVLANLIENNSFEDNSLFNATWVSELKDRSLATHDVVKNLLAYLLRTGVDNRSYFIYTLTNYQSYIFNKDQASQNPQQWLVNDQSSKISMKVTTEYFLFLMMSGSYTIATRQTDLTGDVEFMKPLIDNFIQFISNLSQIQSLVQQQSMSTLNNVQKKSLQLMEIVIIVSFFLIILLFPLQFFVQNRNQEVLRLFATVSPIAINVMIKTVELAVDSEQIEIQQKMKFQSAKIAIIRKSNKSEEIKRKNISTTTPLSKINAPLAFVCLFAFMLIIIQPIVNFYMIQQFNEEAQANIELLGNMYNLRANIASNFLVNLKYMSHFLSPYYSLYDPPYYATRLLTLDAQNPIVISDVIKAVDNNQLKPKKQKSKYDNFFYPLLKSDVCSTLQNNSQFITTSNFVDIEKCKVVIGGILKQGFFMSVKKYHIIYSEAFQIYSLTNQQAKHDALILWQKGVNIKELYQMQMILVTTFDIVKNFFLDIINNDLGSIMNYSVILLTFQLVLLLILFPVGWYKFLSYVNSEMILIRQLLQILHVDFIIENPYIIQFLTK